MSSPDGEIKETLTAKINSLARVNLQAMEAKDNAAQFMGSTGAWASGLLMLISLTIQFLLRTRIINSFISPVEELMSVLDDFNSGNRLRRFVDSKLIVEDVRKIGVLVNVNLDQFTVERLNPKNSAFD